MNPTYPPLICPVPEFFDRTPAQKFYVPPLPEIMQARGQIASRLLPQVSRLSQERKRMTAEERRAVFYKLQHDRPIDVSGTKLKIVCTSPNVSLAIVDDEEDDLQKLEQRISAFGKGSIKEAEKNYQVAAPLQTILTGEPQDRLSEALFERYNELIEAEELFLEIEIMVPEITGVNKICESLAEIRREIAQKLRLTNGTMFEHEEVDNTCRAVIRCNGMVFKELVEDKKWQRKIWWFEPKPKFETLHSIIQDFDFSKLKSLPKPAEDASVVCVIDTGVTAGNPFLEPVCKDTSNFFKSFLQKNANPYDEYGHGTGVASLVSYYALNIDTEAQNAGKVWIASARVLDANNQCEDEKLFSKVLEEVISYFVPLGVKIFNLSIGIVNQCWNNENKRTVPRKSWIARKIDYLSRKHNIVFVICTGNIDTSEVGNSITSGSNYPAYFSNEEFTLLDPSQSALALSVGALSGTTRVVGRAENLSILAQNNYPAPFTRRGPGISDEIKPELVDVSGNYVVDNSLNRITTNPGTDVFVASHQLTPAISHNTGTSFSAPRISHHLALLLQDLQQLSINPSAPLLKAFLVNSAVEPNETVKFEEDLRQQFVSQGMTLRQSQDKAKFFSKMLTGYGLPSAERATFCDDYSAILYYDGSIEPDKVALFKIPIPATLKNTKPKRAEKRITITTCHLPEVQRLGVGNYLGTTIRWQLFRGDGNQETILKKMRKKDDVEEEIGDDSNDREIKEFHYGIIARSKGCVQHDYCVWKQHDKNYSQNDYILAVTAYNKWQCRQNAVPLAVVVRIEETSRTIPIYSEIRNSVESQTQVEQNIEH